jgi:hypothetical protein
MKSRPGSGQGEPPRREDRAKWLYYWYLGRFPTRQEEEADEKQAREEAARDEDGKPKS